MAKEKEKTDGKKDLKTTLADINKRFGAMTINKVKDYTTDKTIEAISTGSYSLNKQLGCPGFPKGRIIEVWGLEASGKTLLTLSAAAQCQQNGGVVAFIDAEHALNPTFARSLGVDMDELVFCQPDYGEQALEIVSDLLDNDVVDLIIIDSVAGLVPKKELDGEVGDVHVGLQARMMSQALRILTGKAAKSNTAVVFINQVREKIGVLYGSPNTTSGGNALKFYASVRLEMRKSGMIKEGDKVIGHRATVKVIKNKVGQPHGEAEFNLYYGGHAHPGIDYFGELIEEAVKRNIVEKAGAWYSFKGERLGQGENNSIDFVRNNPSIKEAILKELGV